MSEIHGITIAFPGGISKTEAQRLASLAPAYPEARVSAAQVIGIFAKRAAWGLEITCPDFDSFQPKLSEEDEKSVRLVHTLAQVGDLINALSELSEKEFEIIFRGARSVRSLEHLDVDETIARVRSGEIWSTRAYRVHWLTELPEERVSKFDQKRGWLFILALLPHFGMELILILGVLIMIASKFKERMPEAMKIAIQQIQERVSE